MVQIILIFSSKFRIFFSKGAKMSADGEIEYALKYSGSNIKAIKSSELMVNFPETMVSFLENQIVFRCPGKNLVLPNNDNVLLNSAYVSACMNQGGQGMKYLLSRRDNQFLHVAPSRVIVEHAPDVVIQFLESKLDFNDCSSHTTTTYSIEKS